MILGQRQTTILEAIIRRYIQEARPIASRDLLDDLDFSVSPATVRNDMLQLDELGYLEQPHTSAGRVPTDKGYRFFVDNLTETAGLHARERTLLEDVFGENGYDAFTRELSKSVARISNIFAAVGVLGEPSVSEAGLSQIFDQPEFQNLEHVRAFGRLVDALNEDIGSLIRDEKADERIFIGEENRLKDAHEYTVMISYWKHPADFRGFVALVGPKRMNYPKNISLLRFIHNFDDGE